MSTRTTSNTLFSAALCFGLLCVFFTPSSAYTRTLSVDGIDMACEGKNCSGYGTCKNGQCTCFVGWKATVAGDDCEADDNCAVQAQQAGSTCSGKGTCAGDTLNYPAIQGANGLPPAKCTCSHSSISGENCEWERSPSQAAIRYEGSLVTSTTASASYIVREGKRHSVTASDCYAAKQYTPISLDKDEWLQIEDSGKSGSDIAECADRLFQDDDVIVLEAGAHPNVGNTFYGSTFDCEDVRLGDSSFDDGTSGTYHKVGWCGDTAIGKSFTQISTAYAYDDTTSPGMNNPGNNVEKFVNGLTDSDFEKLGKQIYQLRERSLGGKLIFQISWPLGGPDFLTDKSNNANQDLALLWSKWSSFMNLEKDEIHFTGNDKFNDAGGSGESADLSGDPRDHTLADTSQAARLFAKPAKLAMRRTEAPTSSPTISPTPLSKRQFPKHTCRGGIAFDSDKNWCGQKNPNYDCSCDPLNCFKPASSYPCCVDVSSICI